MRLAAPALVLVLLLLPALRAEEEAPAPSFPASWEGVWKGPCTLVRDGKTAMEFPMELHVHRLVGGREGWTWQVVYGEGAEKQIRPYELLPVDAEKGHFRIDEKNSIVIDAYHEGPRDALHSRFWVADNVIQATYAREGDTLTMTLTTFSAKPVQMSGGKDGIPQVASYRLVAVQRGVLKR